MSTTAARPATILAGAWALSLVLLAALWVRSPFTGPGAMFLVWSVAVIPLMAWSWSRFRSWNVRQVPRSAGFLAAVVVLWIGVALLAGLGIGGEMALDGLIMRREGLRLAGRSLQWLPGIFGLLLSVAGLVASLEARYRLMHGEAGPAGPA